MLTILIVLGVRIERIVANTVDEVQTGIGFTIYALVCDAYLDQVIDVALFKFVTIDVRTIGTASDHVRVDR